MHCYDFFSVKMSYVPQISKHLKIEKKNKTLFFNIREFLLTMLTLNLPIGICYDFVRRLF